MISPLIVIKRRVIQSSSKCFLDGRPLSKSFQYAKSLWGRRIWCAGFSFSPFWIFLQHPGPTEMNGRAHWYCSITVILHICISVYTYYTTFSLTHLLHRSESDWTRRLVQCIFFFFFLGGMVERNHLKQCNEVPDNGEKPFSFIETSLHSVLMLAFLTELRAS